MIVGSSAAVAALVLLIKHWDKVKAAVKSAADFIMSILDAMLAPFSAVVEAVGKIASKLGPGRDDNYDPLSDPTGLVSANRGIIESRSVSENRQTVDINIPGLPHGSTVTERGKAPAVKLNYGFAGQREHNR
jgi:hypothetical protein